MVWSKAQPHGSHFDCVVAGHNCWHPGDDGGGTPPDAEFLAEISITHRRKKRIP